MDEQVIEILYIYVAIESTPVDDAGMLRIRELSNRINHYPANIVTDALRIWQMIIGDGHTSLCEIRKRITALYNTTSRI